MEEVSKICVCFHSCFKTCGSNRLFPFVPLLLLVAVLSSFCYSGKASVGILPKIVASAGESVLLPCNTTIDGDVPTVEWTKEGLFPNTAFLYRDGCETFEMKNPVFQYRTNLIRHELHNGNLSLVISNVQPNDSGKYQCVIRRNKKKQVITTLELFVGAVSEPKLTVVPGVGGGLTLQCEAKCWFPEPLITLLDHLGNEISTEDSRRDEDSPGCLTVTRRVTLQTSTNRVTCRVYQPEINQTRDLEIYIPDEYQRSYTVIVAITIVTTFMVTVIFALIVCLFKKHDCCVGGQKWSPGNENVTINQNTNENDHKYRQSQVIQPSESTSDSKSSTDVSIPPTEFDDNNSDTKPKALTNSSRPNFDSLPQTTEDSKHLAPSLQMKRSSHDSSSALSTSNDAELSISPRDSKDGRLTRLSLRLSRTGSIRPQLRNTEDSEPLMNTGTAT